MQHCGREFRAAFACVFKGIFSLRVTASDDPASPIEKGRARRRTADVERQDEVFGRALHLFEFRQQGGPALQLGGQGLDRAEGRGTDVVFHSLDVMMDHLLVEAEQGQEIGE